MAGTCGLCLDFALASSMQCWIEEEIYQTERGRKKFLGTHGLNILAQREWG